MQSLENSTRFNGDDLCRLKIFNAPTGGDLNDYVTKTEFVEGQNCQNNKIDALEELLKGPSYLYTIDNNIGGQVSSPGQISTNTGFWLSLIHISEPTRPY